ncbi:MAG: peptidylprolyl isomerase [Bacilli bacterium]
MNFKKKNLIGILIILLVTNFTTYYISSGKTSVLGKKTNVKVASVDNKDFTSNDIYKSWKATGQSASTLSSLISAVDSYILNDKYKDDKSVQKEIEKKKEQLIASYTDQGQDFESILKSSGISMDDWTKMFNTQTLTEVETKNYVKSIIKKDEVKKAYEADEAKIRTSHILFKVKTDESKALEDLEKEAKAKADDVYTKLIEEIEKSDDKQKTFAKYAKEYSEDVDSKEKGGDIGFSNSEDLEYQNAVINIEVGDITEVVKTSYGYEIIMKTDIQEKKSLDNKSVYEKYLNQIAEEKITDNATYSEVAMIELRSKYGLKFTDTSLGEQYSASLESTNKTMEEASTTDN